MWHDLYMRSWFWHLQSLPLFIFIFFFWWGGQLMPRVRRYKVQMPCQVPPITSPQKEKKSNFSWRFFPIRMGDNFFFFFNNNRMKQRVKGIISLVCACVCVCVHILIIWSSFIFNFSILEEYAVISFLSKCFNIPSYIRHVRGTEPDRGNKSLILYDNRSLSPFLFVLKMTSH